jgi:AcrR family transcriptional regulator
MGGAVKKPRRYYSPKRQAQAAATRSRLIAAATKLFAQRGFLGTTMAEVATEAGVSTPMVFAAFQSKANLLTAAIGVAVRGDEASAPLRESDTWQKMLNSPSGPLLIGRFAAIQRSINARAWALIDVGRAAAASDPALAELVATGARNRWSDCREIAEVLAAAGRLARHVDTHTAADRLWCMCSSELYRMLVIERGWTAPSYERWLRETLTTQLLPADTPGIDNPTDKPDSTPTPAF